MSREVGKLGGGEADGVSPHDGRLGRFVEQDEGQIGDPFKHGQEPKRDLLPERLDDGTVLGGIIRDLDPAMSTIRALLLAGDLRAQGQWAAAVCRKVHGMVLGFWAQLSEPKP